MTNQDGLSGIYVDTFVARQPVFDADKRLWGYDLLYRHGIEALQAVFEDEQIADVSVVAGLFLCQPQDLAEGKKILVNFAESSVTGGVVYALPAHNTVIQVHAAIRPSPAFVTALDELRAEGYLVALDGFDADTPAELLQRADLVIVSVLQRNRQELAALVEAAGSSRTTMAKQVESREAFALARETGFDLFQGFFFQQPVILPGRTLTSSETTRLALLRQVQQEEVEFNELADTIKGDVSVSYRLLKYLNSSFFGLPREIASIEQAVVMLGWKQIRNWLRVIVLTDISPEDTTSELPFISVQRGRFLELTARDAGLGSEFCETLFLLGLFSLLDAMLSMPMDEIASNLALAPELEAALRKEPGTLCTWLTMAEAFEGGDWEQVDELVDQLGLSSSDVACSYSLAHTWAHRFFTAKV